MDEIYYVKKGKRYVPVSYYDGHVMDSFPKGSTLVVVEGNATSRRYNIDPIYAPFVAAGMFAEKEMVEALMKGSEARPTTSPITQEQKDAWDAFAKAMGEELRSINYQSACDVVRSGVSAMAREAQETMKNEAVRNAYEQFLMLYKLCKESNE
jgi:hypothetical protein